MARGHEVVATATSAGRLGVLKDLGAEAVVMDGLDAASVGEAVAAARPDVIVDQMTGLSAAHAGKFNPRKPERFAATTNLLRKKAMDHLLAAAEASGVARATSPGSTSTTPVGSRPFGPSSTPTSSGTWAPWPTPGRSPAR